jgi:hypothetical protein
VGIPVIEEIKDVGHDATTDVDVIPVGDETSFIVLSSPVMQVTQLVANPKTESPGKRSKCGAETVDKSSLERAERIKAARNLDFQGNIEPPQPPSFLASDEEVIHNLGVVGISLGLDPCSVSSSLSSLRQDELDRLHTKPKLNKVENIFDEEEREERENEEVDKLILNALCSEIMDEVMDMGSAYPKDCNTTPISKPSSTTTKKASMKKNSKRKNSILK